jgi:hypothetical protein
MEWDILGTSVACVWDATKFEEVQVRETESANQPANHAIVVGSAGGGPPQLWVCPVQARNAR